MIPVNGYKHLYRDEKSGAIVSTDSQGYLQYKKITTTKEISRKWDTKTERRNWWT